MNEKPLFTFVVITYNQESLILEALESIKYQISEYGQDYRFQLIIGDDGSKDRTLLIAGKWANDNACLFEDVSIVSDGINHGICDNCTKTWDYIKGRYCRFISGDDVCAKTNLFTVAELLDSHDIVSCLPLKLENGIVSKSFIELFNIVASSVVYKQNYNSRIKRVSVANDPSIIFSNTYYEDDRIKAFVNQYRIVNDFSRNIIISELYKPDFLQTLDLIVYYRIHAQSSFHVVHDQYMQDTASCYEYLIQHEDGVWGRTLLKNRLWCHLHRGNRFVRLLNIDYYIYFVKILINIIPIVTLYKSIKCDISEHQDYYNKIHKSAEDYLTENGFV